MVNEDPQVLLEGPQAVWEVCFGAAERSGRANRTSGMSRLRWIEAAIVDEHKITRYLLSIKHPRARKGTILHEFGFRLGAWEELRSAVLRNARENDIVDSVVTQFGTKYRVAGRLPTPDCRNPRVRAVWFVERGEEPASFCHPYPI